MRPESSGGRTHRGEPTCFERGSTVFPCSAASALFENRPMCSKSVPEVSHSVGTEARRRQAHVFGVIVFEKEGRRRHGPFTRLFWRIVFKLDMIEGRERQPYGDSFIRISRGGRRHVDDALLF